MSRITAALVAAVSFGMAGIVVPTWADDLPVLGDKKALSDDSDSRSPDSTPGVEAYLLRAYPETEIPGDATLAAQSGWAALNAGTHSTGAWQLIGPSKATYPSVLNPFLFDGAQYVASGRVTAMAIYSVTSWLRLPKPTFERQQPLNPTSPAKVGRYNSARGQER